MTDRSQALADATEKGVVIALEALQDVANDGTAPCAARVQASNTLLNVAGLLGRNSDAADDKERNLQDMAIEDLKQLKAALEHQALD